MTPDKLIYVDDTLLGISRKGAGRGWAYYCPKDQLIKDRAEKRRLNAIALPPAYAAAWFCLAPNGHILGAGIDAKRRKQYGLAARNGACSNYSNKAPMLRNCSLLRD